jgi:1-deoxy-D-xylulose-5-phosphate reductoisomerase
VTALTARGNADRLAALARLHRAAFAVVADPGAYGALKAALSGSGIEAAAGPEAVVEAARRSADWVMAGIVGAAGLPATLAAVRRGAVVAFANKEVLVCAGEIVMAEVARSGARLLPVDSEHNAVFQCLEGHRSAAGTADAAAGVRRVVLTASGGAFRDWPVERLAAATPADALKHPNWAMGPKITVDSATLANKGLELIEAQWLFGLRPGQCEAILHPQSIVHCLVEFTDGSMLAQLCPPSMTFPIQHALLHPERAPGADAGLDLSRLLNLEFRPVDEARFPMLQLAKAAMTAGGVAPAIYNAANEIAVAAFLAGRIPFLAIPQVVEHTLATIRNFEPDVLSAVVAIDAESRRVAGGHLQTFSS